MNYFFDTNDRPFKAIQAGTKTIEGRTFTKYDNTPYNKMKKGDIITLTNNETREKMKLKVKFVHHYHDVRAMLQNEGPYNVLSSEPKTIEHGIESYNSLKGYRDGIQKYGIYAVCIELLQ